MREPRTRDKMFEIVSDEVRLESLLKVVRNLIVNSKSTEIFKLSEILRENRIPTPVEFSIPKKEEIKEKIKEEVREKLSILRADKNDFVKDIYFENKSVKKFAFEREAKQLKGGVKRVLRIPKISFPSHLKSVKPAPSEKVTLDLGKLEPLIQDPHVVSIETEGESEPVYVAGSFGRKPTNIRLSKVEIDEVINRFSRESKIPKRNGMFKVAVGKLLLTAMISDSVSPRFVIEKLKSLEPAPGPGGNYRG